MSESSTLTPVESLAHETMAPSTLDWPDSFVRRHIGPQPGDIREMLQFLDFDSLDALSNAAVPGQIRHHNRLQLPLASSEFSVLQELKSIANQNQVFRSFIGQGYSDCITPPIIQRNILENPGWYTQYTPYQAEISQGRLEALLNFQTMVCGLTGLQIANASLLDEATAAAEAMAMCYALKGRDSQRAFWIASDCHPQTIAVVRTRAEAMGIRIVEGKHDEFDFAEDAIFGALVQYPTTEGRVHNYRAFAEAAHQNGALLVAAADLLALTLLAPPGEWGADIAVGSAQRFGVPLGYGGPHAAYLAARDAHKRLLPGRLVGVSKDAQGQPALRLSLQTREQHIRREKATSNICTAQVLLAIMASMYAVYHGPNGLTAIAKRLHRLTRLLAAGLQRLDCSVLTNSFFDTLRVKPSGQPIVEIISNAEKQQINLLNAGDDSIGISLDEATSAEDVIAILKLFNQNRDLPFSITDLVPGDNCSWPENLERKSPFLQHPVFNRYHSETEMLRYIRRLESRDLSLTTSMIPLGSCTMKLNAAVEMFPVTWPEFGKLHPFAPLSQTQGYQKLFNQLSSWLAEVTGFAATSLQPNAGSQGELSGLLVIRKYHENRGEPQRTVCLIPTSAHGTNPASAVLAGFSVVPVKCAANGDIDLDDLRAKATEHASNLAALMVTYPSTHGVFEEPIKEICQIVHEHGGQVYMDGANLNAQVGLCRPGDIGADVCHVNLHKTFCIPHGGGGPGMGPICVAQHLEPFLPGHPIVPTGGKQAIGPVSAAPWGSPSILPISWVYMRLMGPDGLTEATQVAILNANYIAQRLKEHFPVLYQGPSGLVAHECILDLRQFKSVTVEDVAKRLMDYGFHAPTISWPVPGTMMVEPTESESREELDRFCEAMIAIHAEITAIESGQVDSKNNLLKNAPHSAEAVTADQWTHDYSRQQAAYPTAWLHTHKFWPPVGRIDNVYGDRNPVCTCVGIEAYEE